MSESAWNIPEPLAVHRARVDDSTVIALRRHGNPEGPRLVLSHGNGYAIDLYYPFWSLLAGSYDLVIHDLRNHGWNAVGPLKTHTIPHLVHDQERVLDEIDHAFGAKPKIGIYHSLSALVSLLAGATPGKMAGRVLFEPPLRKPALTDDEFDTQARQLAAMARRRSHLFQTEDQFVELINYLPMFDLLVPGVPQLFAQTTLRKAVDGSGYELRCPREYEAQIAEYFTVFAAMVDFDASACPTKVIGGDPTIPYSCLPARNLSDMFSIDYDFLPDSTHLLPLEKPQECAALVIDYITSIDGFGIFTQ